MFFGVHDFFRAHDYRALRLRGQLTQEAGCQPAPHPGLYQTWEATSSGWAGVLPMTLAWSTSCMFFFSQPGGELAEDRAKFGRFRQKAASGFGTELFDAGRDDEQTSRWRVPNSGDQTVVFGG